MQLAAGISLSSDANGRQYLSLQNQFCQAEIALQGAQLLNYHIIQQGQTVPLLWCSPLKKVNRPIRGGIPLCFPWFGAHSQPSYPAHGFARNLDWQLVSTAFDANTGHRLHFRLTDSAYSRTYWDHGFVLDLEMQCGPALTLTLHVSNVGSRDFAFNFAWHSYFAISQISQIEIAGLQSTPFLDQLQQQWMPAAQQPVGIRQEIDRIYLDAGGTYRIDDQDSQIMISSPDANSAVVWNPWQEKSARLGDIAGTDWQQFVCLECGQLGDAIVLPAKQQQSFRLILSKNFTQKV